MIVFKNKFCVHEESKKKTDILVVGFFVKYLRSIEGCHKNEGDCWLNRTEIQVATSGGIDPPREQKNPDKISLAATNLQSLECSLALLLNRITNIFQYILSCRYLLIFRQISI